MGGGEGEGEGEDKNLEYPFNPEEYSTVYVSEGGDDKNSGTEELPLKTLKAAYAKALADSNKRIAVLTNLSGADADELDASSAKVDEIVIEGRHYGLKIERSQSSNKSVINIKGGAQIVFKNIFINGKMSNSAVFHAALDIGGTGTKVTLVDGTKITGRKLGTNEYSAETQGSGVRVHTKAQLVMKEGSSIVDCDYVESGCGAVMVQSGATFEMNGGSISNNTGVDGGGVYVYSESTATEEDISNFVMNGGVISENVSKNGGGVYLLYSTFTMNAGSEIHDNESGGNGGGVCIWDGGMFMMVGGEISLNRSPYGGGVYLRDNNKSTFKITGGAVYGANDFAKRNKNTDLNLAATAAFFKGTKGVTEPEGLTSTSMTVKVEPPQN